MEWSISSPKTHVCVVNSKPRRTFFGMFDGVMKESNDPVTQPGRGVGAQWRLTVIGREVKTKKTKEGFYVEEVERFTAKKADLCVKVLDVG